MKKIFYLLVLFFLYDINSFSQEIIISGEKGNRPLTWNDFAGKPDKQSTYEANTYWNINYGIKGIQFKGDTALFTGLTMKLELNSKQSWVKKESETDYLLKHEQGHFDIGRLCLAAINQAFTNGVFLKKDYQTKPSAIFSDTLEKYHEMGALYDKETDHSKNKEEQKRWDVLIDKLLSGN